MLPNIADLREKIKKSGLTKRKICLVLGFDEPWLNKVLRDPPTIKDPGYNKIRKVWNYIEETASTNEKTAGEICKHPLITVKTEMTLSEITKKLQKKTFTQAPVTFGDHIIGVITLNKIYELLATPNFDKNTVLGKKHVIEVLTIPYDHPIGNLGKTLQSEPCLLVEKDGKKYGIITIEDIVTNL